MARHLRYLRVTWTVLCGIACVLWVRSYSRLQIVEKPFGSHVFQISSVKDHFAVACLKPYAAIGRTYLSVVAGDAADWRKAGSLGFAYYRDGTVTALVMPHWLYALAFAVFATILSTTQHYRFSLRTLLIATTLVAVVLGLIVAVLRWPAG